MTYVQSNPLDSAFHTPSDTFLLVLRLFSPLFKESHRSINRLLLTLTYPRFRVYLGLILSKCDFFCYFLFRISPPANLWRMQPLVQGWMKSNKHIFWPFRAQSSDTLVGKCDVTQRQSSHRGLISHFLGQSSQQQHQKPNTFCFHFDEYKTYTKFWKRWKQMLHLWQLM